MFAGKKGGIFKNLKTGTKPLSFLVRSIILILGIKILEYKAINYGTDNAKCT